MHSGTSIVRTTVNLSPSTASSARTNTRATQHHAVAHTRTAVTTRSSPPRPRFLQDREDIKKEIWNINRVRNGCLGTITLQTQEAILKTLEDLNLENIPISSDSKGYYSCDIGKSKNISTFEGPFSLQELTLRRRVDGENNVNKRYWITPIAYQNTQQLIWVSVGYVESDFTTSKHDSEENLRSGHQNPAWEKLAENTGQGRIVGRQVSGNAQADRSSKAPTYKGKTNATSENRQVTGPRSSIHTSCIAANDPDTWESVPKGKQIYNNPNLPIHFVFPQSGPSLLQTSHRRRSRMFSESSSGLSNDPLPFGHRKGFHFSRLPDIEKDTLNSLDDEVEDDINDLEFMDEFDRSFFCEYPASEIPIPESLSSGDENQLDESEAVGYGQGFQFSLIPDLWSPTLTSVDNPEEDEPGQSVQLEHPTGLHFSQLNIDDNRGSVFATAIVANNTVHGAPPQPLHHFDPRLEGQILMHAENIIPPSFLHLPSAEKTLFDSPPPEMLRVPRTDHQSLCRPRLSEDGRLELVPLNDTPDVSGVLLQDGGETDSEDNGDVSMLVL